MTIPARLLTVLTLAAVLSCGAADAAHIEEWTVDKQVFGIDFDLQQGYFVDADSIHTFYHSPSNHVVLQGAGFIQLVASGPSCVFIGDNAGTIYRWAHTNGYFSWTSIGTNVMLGGFTIGPDGNLWFTEPAADKIGRLTAGGSLKTFPLPSSGSWPYGITSGPDGRIYFVEKSGNRIGRINVDGTSLTEFPLPPSEANAQPVGIAVLGNQLAFTESNLDRIGWFDILSSTFSHDQLVAGSNPWNIVSGPLASVFFTERGTNKIGYFNDNNGVHEVTVPTPNSDPFAIAVDRAGNVIFSELTSKKIAKLSLSYPGDANGDGNVDVADVFYLINFLFAGGPDPK